MKPFLCFRTRIGITPCLMVAMTATTLSWAQVDPTQVDPIKLVDLVAQSHGHRSSEGPPVKIGDWRAEGTITLFKNGQPGSSFPVVILGKDDGRTQRMIDQGGVEIWQGSDGARTWNSIAGQFTSRPSGAVAAQIESRTSRSVQALFRHQTLGLRLEYQGMEEGHYLIDAWRGRSRTRYWIDEETYMVTALEFEFGTARDPFQGLEVPRIHRVEFGDYRRIQDVMTPFQTVYRIDGVQIEEIVLDSASYSGQPAG